MSHLSPMSNRICGCWFTYTPIQNPLLRVQKSFLPLRCMRAHATIKDVTSRTVLTQTFFNDRKENLKDIKYSFPLYDGVSVVSFSATIGDVHINGIVKEKQQARRDYQDAIDQGSSAGLLEQLPEASDVFVTSIGNIPAGAEVIVKIVYIGELRHDAQSNGTRFTIPSFIAPRYGTTPDDLGAATSFDGAQDSIHVVVDFQGPEGCPVQQIQSPSHPVTVSIGRTSDMPTSAYSPNRGSALLSLDTTTLNKDFVVVANVMDADKPKAFLETHTTIPNQRALIATLVPRFNLAPTYGEIVFIVDRSGSMGGKMDMVKKAMTILLKSLPLGVKFNICSFGSSHSFMWPRSQSYNDSNMDHALQAIGAFDSDYGGTELYPPVSAAISNRFSDMHLDTIILTDGEIWHQDALFSLIRGASEDGKCRFFSLGIGEGCSTSLVEGIATSGNGFSQFVTDGEKMDRKLVRLLKGALTPHISNYSLEVKYRQEEEGYEIVESVEDASKVESVIPKTSKDETETKPTISLYDDELDIDSSGDMVGTTSTQRNKDKFSHLPVVSPPSILQAPCKIPALYSFSRTTVYLLLDPSTRHGTPVAVILRATSEQGPLELEIKVEDIGMGETIHQLASKKAVSELEKSGGWLAAATDKTDGTLLKTKYEGRWEELVEREAVRLGVKFQVAGKWCSFVAVDGDTEHDLAILDAKASSPGGGLSAARTSTVSAAYRKKPAGGGSFHPVFGMRPPPVFDGSSPPALGGSPWVPPAVDYNLSVEPCSTTSPQYSNPYHQFYQAARPSYAMASRPSYSMAASSATPPPPPSVVARKSSRASKKVRQNRQIIPNQISRVYQSAVVSNDHSDHDDKAHAIIRLQKTDGSWDWNQDLLNILGMDLTTSNNNPSIVATSLAIVFLEKHFPQEVESWELIVEKAKSWLRQLPFVDLDKEISDAEKILGV